MLKLVDGKRFGLVVGGGMAGFGRAYAPARSAFFVAFWTPATGFVVLTWRGLTVVKGGRSFGRIWRPVFAGGK